MPEHRLSQKALICHHLFEGAPLRYVYRWYSGKYKWRFFCGPFDCSTTVVTLGEALEQLPEIEPFLKRSYDCSILYYRDEVGGHLHKDILE